MKRRDIKVVNLKFLNVASLEDIFSVIISVLGQVLLIKFYGYF